ncbi:MAG: hypothetical protein R2749_11445 [Acidimicrobiales bacterium]
MRELEMPVIVGGCASYQAALHLMRTGAATCSWASVRAMHHPRRARDRRAQATAIADATAAACATPR